MDSEYRPQLATLVTEPPRGDAWLHETKFDGYSIGCRVLAGPATLISRNGKDWTHAFPEIGEAPVRFGALVIGCYGADRLVCAGKVGTGFTQKVALDLRRCLDSATQKSSPFDPPPGGLGRSAHRVKPALVCEMEFAKWTGDGKNRSPKGQIRGSNHLATEPARHD